MKWYDWGVLLADVFAVPAILLGFGWRFLKKPPQGINSAYGYRTPMSMKNRDTWDFAHRVCGRVWWRLGWLLLALSVVLLCSAQLDWLLGILVALGEGVALLLTVIPVERALRREFDQHGVRRQG